MFTLADIRNIAIQIEENGEKSYRRAAESAADPEIAALLLKMADDERRHRDWFAAIQTEQDLTEEQRELEAAGKAILQEMVRDRTFSLDEGKLAATTDQQELLAQAQGFEEDTILFYEMLMGFVDDEATREHLQQIIDEERRHCENLARLGGAR